MEERKGGYWRSPAEMEFPWFQGGDTVRHPESLPLEEATMANKDKGGSKSSKTAASKTLKEKRQAKKAKGAGSNPSSSGSWTKK